jgi:hypothetical protein
MLAYLVILALVILADTAGRWAFLPARYLPRNRARALQVRLHLRLHPGKGFATVVGLWLRWGRLAALRRSARIRPSLPWWLRALVPGEQSVFLGRAHWRHGLRVPLEEHVLVMAPPRTFKTAFLADVILRYPGPVIATTTKADVFALTAAVRGWRGRVHVFNPQFIGGVASTFSWSPVEGCEDPATAIRRADAFAFAVSREGVEDGTFWSAKASDYLRGYFHAAALGGYDMLAVAAWVSGADPRVPEQVLIGAGAHQWALTLAELRSEAHKTTATVRMVMSRALAFMADPALAASVLPRPGEGFDIPSFLFGCGTVYLIAEAIGEGRQVVMDTSSVKVFLPGITDTGTLEMASTLCGQASWKIRGEDHASHHAVATPDMIRQLPMGFALVIRGGNAPVIARLPRAWNNPAYRRGRRRHRGLPLPVEPGPGPEPGTEHEEDACPEDLPSGWSSGTGESFPWSRP